MVRVELKSWKPSLPTMCEWYRKSRAHFLQPHPLHLETGQPRLTVASSKLSELWPFSSSGGELSKFDPFVLLSVHQTKSKLSSLYFQCSLLKLNTLVQNLAKLPIEVVSQNSTSPQKPSFILEEMPVICWFSAHCIIHVIHCASRNYAWKTGILCVIMGLAMTWKSSGGNAFRCHYVNLGNEVPPITQSNVQRAISM